MPRGMHLTKEQQDEIVRRHNAGEFHSLIARDLGIETVTIRHFLARYRIAKEELLEDRS